MNTDRELLELAAKAAGIEGAWDGYGFNVGSEDDIATTYWNPLTDDGDALRLAEKLRIEIRFHENVIRAIAYSEEKVLEVAEISTETGYSGLRRVIVMAAAEIGRKIT